MYFLSLEVDNIRCFCDKQTLDLSDGQGNPAQWTLLLGDNGVGKTTLLQCLALMCTVEEPKSAISTYPDAIKHMIEDKMKNFTNEKSIVKPIMDDLDQHIMEALTRTGDEMASSVRATYSLQASFNDQQAGNDKHSIEVGMILEKHEGALEVIHPVPDCLPVFETPDLFAYSAGRHMGVHNLNKSELHDPIANFISDSADLYDAEQILLNFDYRALKFPKENTGPLLTKVKQLLSDLLPDIEHANDIEILGPKVLIGDAESGIVVRTPYGLVPLNALSLGYKNMLALVVDLAMRLWRCNPDSASPLEEPAIVIVDEMDLHLHPKWQRQVKTLLCQHFPNAQFICTAHSPFMAQAAEEDNVAVLLRDADHVNIENNALLIKGWRIDQIATSDLIGVPSARSIEIEALINERQDILAKAQKSSMDSQRLTQLDAILSELPVIENPDDQAAMELIQKAAKLIEKNEQD